MSKHTPGPWVIDHYRQIKAGAPPRTILVEGVALPQVATLESAANARLIASAPDLLEALKEARDWVARELFNIGPCDHDVGLCICQDKSLLVRIDAAISKATGDT